MDHRRHAEAVHRKRAAPPKSCLKQNGAEQQWQQYSQLRAAAQVQQLPLEKYGVETPPPPGKSEGGSLWFESQAMRDEVRALRSRVDLLAHMYQSERKARVSLQDGLSLLKELYNQQADAIERLERRVQQLPPLPVDKTFADRSGPEIVRTQDCAPQQDPVSSTPLSPLPSLEQQVFRHEQQQATVSTQRYQHSPAGAAVQHSRALADSQLSRPSTSEGASLIQRNNSIRLAGDGSIVARDTQTIEYTVHKISGRIGLGLGGGGEGAPVYVHAIAQGGAAAVHGGMQVGDRLLKVNGVDVREATKPEAVAAMNTADDAVRFVLLRDPVFSTRLGLVPSESYYHDGPNRSHAQPRHRSSTPLEDAIIMSQMFDGRGPDALISPISPIAGGDSGSNLQIFGYEPNPSIEHEREQGCSDEGSDAGGGGADAALPAPPPATLLGAVAEPGELEAAELRRGAVDSDVGGEHNRVLAKAMQDARAGVCRGAHHVCTGTNLRTQPRSQHMRDRDLPGRGAAAALKLKGPESKFASPRRRRRANGGGGAVAHDGEVRTHGHHTDVPPELAEAYADDGLVLHYAVVRKDPRNVSQNLGIKIHGGTSINSKPGIYILNVADDGPVAAEGTLKPHDRIMMVDDRDMRNATRSQAFKALLGTGSSVNILVGRDARDRTEPPVTRL